MSARIGGLADWITTRMTTCVVCGHEAHAGLGDWAFHPDADMTDVCRGPCFRVYTERKRASAALAHWMDMLALWGNAPVKEGS